MKWGSARCLIYPIPQMSPQDFPFFYTLFSMFGFYCLACPFSLWYIILIILQNQGKSLPPCLLFQLLLIPDPNTPLSSLIHFPFIPLLFFTPPCKFNDTFKTFSPMGYLSLASRYLNSLSLPPSPCPPFLNQKIKTLPIFYPFSNPLILCQLPTLLLSNIVSIFSVHDNQSIVMNCYWNFRFWLLTPGPIYCPLVAPHRTHEFAYPFLMRIFFWRIYPHDQTLKHQHLRFLAARFRGKFLDSPFSRTFEPVGMLITKVCSTSVVVVEPFFGIPYLNSKILNRTVIQHPHLQNSSLLRPTSPFPIMGCI